MPAFKKPKEDKKLKISDEIIEKVANAMRAGAYVETAAAINGISKQTLYAWFKKGNEKPNSIYKRLIDAVEKAQAEGEMRDLLNVDKSAMGRDFQYERNKDGSLALNGEGNPIVKSTGSLASWQASAWRLERKFPRKWGRLDRLETSGPDAGPQVILTMPDNGRTAKDDKDGGS